ncbi:MAG: DUF3341 domain-containing protein [Rhodanobacteraceae bacterium]
MSETRIYGLLAEFADAEQLRGAALRARHDERYTAIEAYSPFPIDGLGEALDQRRVHVPFWTLLGAICGGGGTYALEWYSAAIDYPINVGGRPPFSWPAFFPPALEMTILWAALFGVFAMLIGNGLPRLHHPLFAVPAFDRASNDRYFLLLRADDPNFDAARAREFFDTLSPLSINEVAE